MQLKLSESRIHIVGIARNIEHVIASDVAKLDEAFNPAKRLTWEILESDSIDGTLAILQQLSSIYSDFKVTTLSNLENLYPRRTERLAYCRNMLLANFQENKEKYDYLVVADLDGVNGKLTREAIISCWENEDWDVCTANQSGPYYDVWALRHESWSPNDCWKQYHFLRDHNVSEHKALQVAVLSRMVTLPVESEWIQVTSAFGGLAIYKSEILDNGVAYMGLDENSNDICEHVPLNEYLVRKGSKIFINPRLINTDLTEHSRRFLRERSLNGKIRNAIKSILNYEPR